MEWRTADYPFFQWENVHRKMDFKFGLELSGLDHLYSRSHGPSKEDAILFVWFLARFLSHTLSGGFSLLLSPLALLIRDLNLYLDF